MIRVLVVHEHRLVGDMIAAALRSEQELRVAHCLNKVDSVAEYLEQIWVDVVLVSMNLPESSALPLVRRISQRYEKVKVVVTNLIRSKTAILQCLEEGAAGYVLEDESIADLIYKILSIHQDNFRVTPDISAALITRLAELKRLIADIDLRSSAQLENSYNDLTPREQEVLHLLAKGLTNQEIAEALVIEVGTVKNHVHNIFRKLDIHERQHAAALAQHIL
jgi:DNA-binding NarL/FixJ family response regulator